MVKRAIIHVENTKNLVPFAKFLVDSGWTIITANKTEDFLREEKIPVSRESALVQTAHYLNDTSALIRQILNSKYSEDEFEQDTEKNDSNIFLVCMNVNPFFDRKVNYKEVAKPFSFYISTLIRNSFVNYENVLILTDPDDYDEAMIQLKTNNITKEFRIYLAAKALNLVSAYDSGIASSVLFSSDNNKDFMRYLTFPFTKQLELHNGTNPQQKASLYKYPEDIGAVSGFQKLQGKELTYNIISDISVAWDLISSLYENLKNQYTVQAVNADGYNFTTQFTPLMGTVFTVAVKYTAVLGAALSTNAKDSFINMFNFDSENIKDVAIGCSSVVDEDAANEMVKCSLIAIVAPGFTDGAKQILSANKNIRLIPTAKVSCPDYDLQLINGGVLFQTRDSVIFEQWNIKTKNRPSQFITDEMAFGMLLAMKARTYATVLVKNNAVVGFSQSCKSPKSAIDNALSEAKEIAIRTKSDDKKLADLLVSDTTITLTDSIKELIDNGLSAIIQTGSATADKEFINYCDEHNVVMVYTLMSHITY